MVAVGTIARTFEDDENAERRLSNLLWQWTSPEVDRTAFMQCNDEAEDVGTQMRTGITQRYRLRTSVEVGDHRRRLQAK